MQDCNEIVKSIYNHPDICNLISKIKPESIRDDLKQEMAISLLEQPCDKIASLFAQNNLIRYAIRTCWLMATSKNTPFYYTFKKKDLTQAVEYMQSLQICKNIPISIAFIAKEALNKKADIDVYNDHDVRIFNKFIELGGVRKVARFYGIPAMHVSRVVTKVRHELKQELCKMN